MVIREENEKLIITLQHDHAQLSGKIAERFDRFFVGEPLFNDVLFAIHQHDRSWILPDSHPKWNPQAGRPHDFIDYPQEEKLMYYRLGLNETEQLNPYAGLLCSMHYTSFIDSDTKDPENSEFLSDEHLRQKRLRSELGISDKGLLQYHFQLLQLCDNLSLYLCLNKPGAAKSEEHPFFKKGFKNSSRFNPEGEKNLIAYWRNEKEVHLVPFPFKESFTVNIEQRHLLKNDLEETGLEKAIFQCELRPLKILFSAP